MSYETVTTGVDLDKGFHSDTVWDDIILLPYTIQGGTARPDKKTLIGNIDVYGFNGASTTEEMSGSFEIPHSYFVGSDLRPHIHWCADNANAGDVKWQLEYSIFSVDNAPTTVVTLDAVDSTDDEDRVHKVVEFQVIDGTNINIGDIIGFRLFRDPTDAEDTYGSDALFLSLGYHFLKNGDGSRGVFTK